MERKYFTGCRPSLTPATVLRHVVVMRLSPLTQLLSNVVSRRDLEDRNATLRKPIWSSLYTTVNYCKQYTAVDVS